MSGPIAPHPLAPWIYPTSRYYYKRYEEENLPSDRPRDGEIKALLVDRLRENGHTRDEDIRVDVKRNVAILTGSVSSSLAKRAAGDDAWDTHGVVDVSNQLEVGPEPR